MISKSRQEDAGRLVHATADSVTPEGNLDIPEGAKGIVLFAHGSGSSRFSPRNRFVAQTLRAGGLATLLIEPPWLRLYHPVIIASS